MTSHAHKPEPAAGVEDGWGRAIFAHSPDAIVVLHPDGVIETANEAFSRLIGRPAAALAGQPITAWVAAETVEKWGREIAKLIQGEWTLVEGIRLRGAERTVPVDVSLIARLPRARGEAIILHLRDISAFHTVERALVAALDEWERSFDAITDYMCILDRGGHIRRANLAVMRRFQPGRPVLIGQDYRVLFAPAPTAPLGLADIVTAAPCMVEALTFQHLPGWFQLSSYPLRDADDRLIGAVLIVREITEAYQTREALRKSEASLRQTSKMEAIGRLAGGIAHDFNNMLTSVLGYSALLLRSLGADDPAREDVEEIVRAAERATALTRQLLDFSHERASETRSLNLNVTIENMEKFLRRVVGTDVSLTLQLDPALWNVRADVSRVEQILMNLTVNARDALPRGGRLRVRTANVAAERPAGALPDQPKGRQVLLEVADSGCGMPPEVMEHIFEPFFTTKERGRGTGLGLTTIYGIVKQFGGHITCASEVNQGTTFRIYLPPCAEAAADTRESRGEAAPLPTGTETILVVDDEPNIVALVGQILSELGYRVLAATGSREALELTQRQAGAIALVVSDVIMPEFNGPELVRRMRDARPELKCLYMSGHPSTAAIHKELFTAGAPFLQKPFSFESLAHAVRRVLDNA